MVRCCQILDTNILNVALYTNFQVLDSKDSYCGILVMTPVSLADGYKYCNNIFLERGGSIFQNTSTHLPD
jgi:hypothetical protein